MFGLEGWNNLCQVVGGIYAREYSHSLRARVVYAGGLYHVYTLNGFALGSAEPFIFL